MSGIILCVLMNVGIFTCFKMYARFKVNTFHAITINYLVCVVTGLISAGDGSLDFITKTNETWWWMALFLGFVFIGTFYLMAKTTEVYSMTVSSIASKMSLIIPVLSSIFIIGVQAKTYTSLNIIGMVLALPAIFLSSYKKGGDKKAFKFSWELMLPLLVFVLGGLIDSSINYSNHFLLKADEKADFSIMIFLFAGTTGSILMLLEREPLKLKSVIAGLALGIINFFSIYFLLVGLSSFNNDGAFVYPLINVGIIVISSLVSIIFFRERLSVKNQIGIALAVLAIFLISYQEILSYGAG
ncbi:hypothetical protein [Fulvivirga ligni]|uniref:hypothetical protein n=1 Tax=Fulvivirga ligni TaxID=2904246 RepID=UPI001F37908C|nr:hypothetical protein [Fulvivirga ligni]UII23061.1 hypothetical protein LVD16_07465 [Fulvivirga ligni]